VSVFSPNGLLTRAQYSTVSLIKDATNQWILGGDSTTTTSSAVISASGSFIQSADSDGISTLSFTPAKVGDIVVLSLQCASSTIHATAVAAGGGFGTFVKAEQASNSTDDAEIWYAPVTSSGTAETITVTWSGSVSAVLCQITGQEFTMTGGTNTWTLTANGNASSGSNSTTVTFPTLSPTAAGQLYYGVGVVSETASTTGLTAGYSGTVLGTSGNIVIWNPNCTSASQTPACTQAPTGTYLTVGAVIIAS
jgi:hypothetical protein